MNPGDLQTLHDAMRRQVDEEFLPGVSLALLHRHDVVDQFCCGYADREARIALRDDHLFRIYSNTKLITSCAIMLLVEAQQLGLDDPVERYIPELGQRQVLRPDATSIEQTEPARSSITIRQLMTHTSGLSYGIFAPGSLLDHAYTAAGVLRPTTSLAGMMTLLQPLPLSFHPGERWEYSVATDVLSRVVEVVSGSTFGEFLSQRFFGPLEMKDTSFWVPPARQDRLTVLYGGVEPANPLCPGLVRLDQGPHRGAFLSPTPRESGGGGLVSTLGDMVRFIRALMPGGPTLLRAQTLAEMNRRQVRPDQHVQFPNQPSHPGRLFGLGSSVLDHPSRIDPAQSAGEVSWGGMAGTVWWMHPQHQIAGVLMTQRYLGSGNPYTYEFRRLAYQALGF